MTVKDEIIKQELYQKILNEKQSLLSLKSRTIIDELFIKRYLYDFRNLQKLEFSCSHNLPPVLYGKNNPPTLRSLTLHFADIQPDLYKKQQKIKLTIEQIIKTAKGKDFGFTLKLVGRRPNIDEALMLVQACPGVYFKFDIQKE
ncbi:hypothetical protein FGO68_gene9511 [Halteria grandinella]|uniref:Uncharacterized protein n=1 Tax=Halteria grandinella TaxID=5974 RepID=A0A8J8T2A6_HALGN|nr:hypothetical protein FGO68_gene9511 [Halteria grandinella]